jgi:hypothetical protein
MTVMRDGKCYEVIDQCGDMIAVCVLFWFAEWPYQRELKLWWDKATCVVV